ncbi:MAG: hypothetical protein U0325_20295 [Polyangiales bacterium]
MELIIGVVVLAVLIPLGIWFGDEAGGRAAWRQVIDVRERHALGLGAFRAAEVEVAHSAVLRERAPWWLRLLALTCYLPLSAAILSLLPWLLGVLVLAERHSHHAGLDEYAHALLVSAYPVGCIAALRMVGLGRALLGGDEGKFRASLRGTAVLEVALNGALLLGAAALFARFRRDDALLLGVTPILSLAHLAAVAAIGLRQTRALTAVSPQPSPGPVMDEVQA